MQICVIGTQYLGVPARRGGAIEFLSFELAKGLAEKGHQVTYYSVKSGEEAGDAFPENLSIERFPSGKTNGLLFNLFVFFKALMKKFDLVYFTGCSTLPAAFLLSKTKGIPLVYHEFNHLPWIRGKGLLFDFLAFQSVKNADFVLVPSEFIRKKLVEKTGTKARKVLLLKNFLNLSEFPARKRKKNNSLLFVGRLQEHKGLHHLLAGMPELLKENPRLKLRVVGPSGEFSGEESSYRRELEKTIEEKELNESVDFLGQIKRKELVKEFSNSRAFVFPSEEEAFGVVLIEAMASFTPCVAFNVGGVNEIIKDNETGFLVSKGDSAGLTEKISLLLSDSKKAEEFGLNGRKRVERFFGSGKAVQRLEEILGGAVLR